MLNKTFLITRSFREKDKLSIELKKLGAGIINFPLIEIKEAGLNDNNLKKIDSINSYDIIIFTSTNSAKITLNLLKKRGKIFEGEIYCVGDKTKEIIESSGYKVTFVPKKFSANDLVKELPETMVKGKKILFPKGDKSMTKISSNLMEIAYVDDIVVYENRVPEYSTTEIDLMKEKLNDEIDCVMFFSPSAVENFLNLFAGEDYSGLDFAVIGNTTLAHAEEHGLNVKIKPENSTVKDLVNEIKNFYSN
jgi:uroporphyrinogen-III synthase